MFQNPNGPKAYFLSVVSRPESSPILELLDEPQVLPKLSWPLIKRNGSP